MVGIPRKIYQGGEFFIHTDKQIGTYAK
jgi:hypothetical protein